MRNIILLLLISFSINQFSYGARFAYLSSNEGISVYAVSEDGKLTQKQFVGLEGAGPQEPSSDGKHLYVTTSSGKGNDSKHTISTFTINEDGTLSSSANAKISYRTSFLELSPDGQYIAGNHYRDGKASLWSLNDNEIYNGKLACEITLEEKAHSALFSPDGKYLFVPATGPNKIFVNRYDADAGTIEAHEPAFIEAPNDESAARHPRHIVFNRKLDHIAYTTMEHSRPGVAVWHWNTDAGKFTALQNVVTEPKEFDGRISTADLHITPNNKYLYVSRRNVGIKKGVPHPNPKDAIVAFEINEASGALSYISMFSCESIPRSFAIDADGSYMYVAGQGDSKLGVYKILKNGRLKKVTQYSTGPNPLWVEVLDL